MLPLRKTLFSTLILAIMVSTAPLVMAGTATGTMASSATLTSACTLTSNPVAFGNVSGLLMSAATTSTGMSIACSKGTAFNVTMGAGNATGATTTSRAMVNGSSQLNYGIYQDAAFTKNWGTNVAQGGDAVAGTGTGSLTTLTVYVSVPSNQQVAPGTYSDTVNVTVAY